MMRESTSSLPEGLPARFAATDDGFTKLCEFLEIANRSQQQTIVKTAGVKRSVRTVPVRGLSTAQRLKKQLTTFYGLPIERRELWEFTLAHEGRRKPIPSLEYCALKGYDAEFLQREVDEASLETTLDSLPSASIVLSDAPEWLLPALAIWPDLRRDVLHWEKLTRIRQESVAVAVFAVATILDDRRLLDWAADRAAALADEFAFAQAFDVGETERDAVRSTSTKRPAEEQATESQTVGQNEADPSPRPVDANSGDILQKWSQTCAAISECVSTMGGNPPRPDLLGGLQEHVRLLGQLREPIGEVLDATRSENLVAAVADIVTTVAGEHDMSWLGELVDQIHAQWKLAYLVAGVDAAQLQEDVERVRCELWTAVNEWRANEHGREGLQEKLRELDECAYGSGDVLSLDDRRVELQEEIGKATRAVRDARQAIFRVVGPQGWSFDPGENYKQQLEEKSVATPELQPSGDVVPEPVARLATEDVGAVRAETDAGPRPVSDSIVFERPGGEPVAAKPDFGGAAVSPVPEPTATVGTGSVAGASRDSSESSVLESRDASAVWRAVEIGRPGIAYHIAKLLTEQGAADPSMPPADLIAASILADHVQSADDKVVDYLRPFLERIDTQSLSRSDWRNRDAVNLMLFSAALRPALFAPVTGAPALLRRVSLSIPLERVYALGTTVANHVERLPGVRLDAFLFSASLRGAWQDEFETFVARVVDWNNRAKSQTILFQRASRVWKDLLSGDGCLARLVAMISKTNEEAKDDVDSLCKQIKDQKAFDKLVRSMDPSGRKGNPIVGRARTQLWDHVQPVIRFANQWLALMVRKPGSKDFVGERIDTLRGDLLQLSREAVAAIEQEAKSENSLARAAALKHARNTIDALLEIVSDDTSRRGSDGERPSAILSFDLLYVTGLNIDADFRPTNRDDVDATLDLLRDTGAHDETLRAAFDARLKRGDLVGAQLVYNRIDEEGGAESEQCRTSLDREIDSQYGDLKKSLAATEEQLEIAFCCGRIGDERYAMAASLAEMRQLTVPVSTGEPPLDVEAITRATKELSRIQESITAAEAKRIRQTKARFKEVLSVTNLEGTDWSPVDRAIESGDILTANERMDRIEKGETIDLSLTITNDPFKEFWAAVDEIDSARDVPSDVVEVAAGRKHIAGVSFRELSAEDAEDAVKLLEAWYTLSRRKRIDKRTLTELFERLGFKVRRVPEVSGGNLEIESLGDRTICPSRQFGSEAGGRYRVLTNWARSVDESLLQSTEVGAAVPTIVLHFGRLGPKREILRRLAINTHRLFLVVDESLVLFLASCPSGRLAALFRCTLPFTSVDPYATTSGLVPPELFYGRREERRSIMDRFGACFLYGGRQLGKTALLRRVEHDFNRNNAAHVAKWIDLKVNEIGYAKGPWDVWPLLQRELARLRVVPPRRRELDPENRRQVESLRDQVKQWLDGREDRRFLLLLDESDAFLERDAQTDFRESARLKGLMDETERRFKVVFAGLHNVLRTTRQANHPLAHLGDPIRVGAMLSNGEWREAHALVREPLEAVGCQFEREGLSTRILAQTNYYPSLIQLYGAELVRRLRDSAKPFPYTIGDDDINGAYGSPELRSAIRERFLLTLQLDQRYEVIAYVLAFELGEKADLGHGLQHKEIEAATRDWWPEGFEGMTDAEFRMLLDEMEGLGVLRIENDRYTLRNPNVLMLLGSGADIENVLSKRREPPVVYEPASFHARYRDDRTSSTRRGPLTYRQESELRVGGVAVVSGCAAAGLDGLEEFLSERIGEELFQKLPLMRNDTELERALKDLRPVRNMVTVCLLPQDVEWNASWLKVAKHVLDKRAGGRTQWCRVVFTAPPERLWRILTEAEEADLGDVDWVKWVKLGPWDETFLRLWLEDTGLTADMTHVRQLMEASGGWPIVLDRFGRKKASRSWGTRIEDLRNDLRKASALRDFGVESEDVKRVLRMLSQEDPFDRDSIEIVSSYVDLDNTEIMRRVTWSERLGLLSRAGDGCWTFDPLFRRLLAADTS